MNKFTNTKPTETNLNNLDEFDFPSGKEPKKDSKEKPVIFCKGKCDHNMVGTGENGGPIIQCKSCKRTFGDI